MKPNNHDEAAFPAMDTNRYADGSQVLELRYTGMTLRDYFDAKAMQAQLNAIYTNIQALLVFESKVKEGNSVADHLSIESYVIADSMLAERERRNNE